MTAKFNPSSINCPLIEDCKEKKTRINCERCQLTLLEDDINEFEENLKSEIDIQVKQLKERLDRLNKLTGVRWKRSKKEETKK